MQIFSFIFIGLFSSLVTGSQTPQLPEPGEDRILTGGLSAGEFFRKRESDASCRAKLKEEHDAYARATTKLKQSITNGDGRDAVERAEASVAQLKKRLIERVFQCGECAGRPVERRDIGDSIWYVTDGSCSLHGDGAADHYARGRDFLKGIRNYPQYRGGLSHVLEFVSVDPRSGKILWDLNHPESSPVDIFISVRGPTIEFLNLITSVSYFVRGTFQESVSEAVKKFSIQFSAKRPTTGFSAPRVYHLPAYGRVSGQFESERIETTQFALRNVLGSWYLSSDGYVRYFTAADFGELLQGSSAVAGMLGTDLARSILSETLFDLSQVARGQH